MTDPDEFMLEARELAAKVANDLGHHGFAKMYRAGEKDNCAVTAHAETLREMKEIKDTLQAVIDDLQMRERRSGDRSWTIVAIGNEVYTRALRALKGGD